MKNNTTDEVKVMLLSGRHITKLDLFHESDIHSSCLPQRIYDIRQSEGWDIKFKSVKGKGTLREYWLEPDEISRIKGDKQYVAEVENVVETAQKRPDKSFEQLGLGLPGTDSLKEWW